MNTELPYLWKSKNNTFLILVKVFPRSKKNLIGEVIEVNTHYPVSKALTVYLKEVAQDNKANQELLILLSEYFKSPKKNLKIINGLKNKLKVLEFF